MVATRQHPDGDFPDATPTPSPAKNSATPSSKDLRSLTRTPNQSSPSSLQGGFYTHSPPYVLHLWLIIALPLVLWDTGYIMLRPYTLEGGPLHAPIWSLYAIYGAVDHVYGWPAWNARSGFSMAQSVMNAVEAVLYVYYLVVVWREGQVGTGKGKKGKGLAWFTGIREDGRSKVIRGPRTAGAVVVVFAASVMTLSKTMLYMIREYYSDYINIGHNTAVNVILFWIIPNGLWIVFPTYLVYVLGNELVEAIKNNGANTKKKV